MLPILFRMALRASGARTAAVLALWLGGIPPSAAALPLISELFYDAVGSDDGQSFVELYGPPGTPLDGLLLEGINGSSGAVTDRVALGGAIPADGFFVLADLAGDGTTAVAEADLLADFDFQNGPDSVVLVAGGVVVDALGYGVFGPSEVFAGEGSPAPDAPAGSSLARHFADADSGDNAADFGVREAPTPGFAPLTVPEPWSAGLLALGLVLLAGAPGSRR